MDKKDGNQRVGERDGERQREIYTFKIKPLITNNDFTNSIHVCFHEVLTAVFRHPQTKRTDALVPFDVLILTIPWQP